MNENTGLDGRLMMGMTMVTKRLGRILWGCSLLGVMLAKAQTVDEMLAGGLPMIRQRCQQLVDAGERAEKDDTEARVALHGLCVKIRKGSAAAAVEDALLETLAASNGAELRNFVLEQLYLVASERSLPVLALMLAQPEYSDAALRVLLGMDDARVRGHIAQELAGLLPSLTGVCRDGVVQALGELGAVLAAPLLAADALGPDRPRQLLAIDALATINAPEADQAFAALLDRRGEFRGHDAAILDGAYARYLLNLAAWGKDADALRLARAWSARRQGDVAVQCMALTVFDCLPSADAQSLLLAALSSETLRLRLTAGRLLRQERYAGLAQATAETLDAARADAALDILPLLAFWKNPAALPAVEKAMVWEDQTVRAAAIAAAVALLGEQALPRLSGWFTDKRPGVADAAALAVSALEQPVGGALAEMALASAPALRPALLGILERRRETAQLERLAPLAQPDDSATRQALCQLYGVLGQAGQLPFLFAQVVAAGAAADDAWLSAAEKGTALACRRLADANLTMARLREVYPQAASKAKAALLRVALVAANDDALALARDAWQAGDDVVREAALRNLAEWPTVAALPLLKNIAGGEGNPLWQVLAFRGCVRLIPKQSGPRAEQLSQLSAMLPLARREDEKRLVVSALGSVEDVAAFAVLEPFLTDAALQRDAALAIVSLSEKLRSADGIAALRAAMPLLPEGKQQERAKACMELLGKTAGRVLRWQAAGPYKQDGKPFTELHAIIFAPERAEEQAGIEWRTVSADDQGRLDLRQVFGAGARQVVAYVRCVLKVAVDQEAQVFLGSDDGVKAWLNGAVVGEKNVPRGYVADEDKLPLTLRAGDNLLLLKVGQGGGDWLVGASIRASDGGPLPGVTIALP